MDWLMDRFRAGNGPEGSVQKRSVQKTLVFGPKRSIQASSHSQLSLVHANVMQVRPFSNVGRYIYQALLKLMPKHVIKIFALLRLAHCF